MKAVRIFEHGDTSVLKYDDYPMPEAGPSDLVVRVLATSVSRWDVIYRQGIWRKGAFDHKPNPGRRMFPLPMQLGRDAVGVVEAVGSAVTRFRPGDRVVCLPHPENPASPEAIRGLGNLSTGIDLPAHGTFGGNAQFVALDGIRAQVWSFLDMDDALLAATAQGVVEVRNGVAKPCAAEACTAGGVAFSLLRSTRSRDHRGTRPEPSPTCSRPRPGSSPSTRGGSLVAP